ncbi:MAG: tetratricopeptide repeat protein [Nitrospirae bacterium]|nr:tetratricopeptide repeat protein [Nitrospirota bacterium]
MALEDIEKLKARLEKDPSSKLFVPLAEEYRKAGMYDEAIDVLLKELQKQPAYTTARVSLGKIYLERGQTSEAVRELEKVIAAVPDNLFAQKKLAEIYKSIGDTERALSCLQKVLEINPRDEEARKTLDVLTVSIQKSPEGDMDQEVLEVFESGTAEMSAEGFAETVDAGEVVEGSAEEQPFYLEPEPVEKVEFPDAGRSEDIGVADTEGAADFGEYRQFGELAAEEIHEAAGDDSSMFAMPDEVRQEEPFAGITDDSAFSFDDMLEGLTDSAGKPASSEVDALLREADGYIDAGQYMKAVELFRGVLDTDPDNNKVRQRVEELKCYLKMIGKDTGSLVGRLEGFCAGLRSRGNEFFGSS